MARSQFRGQIKRRAFLAQAQGSLSAGQEVFIAGDDQPCGLVVQASSWSPKAGVSEGIVSVSTSTAPDGADLQVAGAPLSLRPVPYALRLDI